MKRLLFIPVVLALGACASERDICERQATRELRALDTMIAETGQALSRGYREERDLRVVTQTVLCPERDNQSLFCDFDTLVEVPRRVAIDPQAEQRKLDNLRALRAAEEGRAEAALASCAARFPPG